MLEFARGCSVYVKHFYLSLDEYVDFDEEVRSEQREPFCFTKDVSPVRALDHLPGIKSRVDIKTLHETGLTEVSLGADVFV